MITGSSNLPVAPPETPWNATAAKARVLEVCGGNVACIGRGFLWRGTGDARSPEAWLLGFCDVIDGRLHIVPKGIAACAGRRGVLTAAIPSEERLLVEARITSIYARVRREYEDWPLSPFALDASITADATGTGLEGTIALEGTKTGDGRLIKEGALTWDEGPWPLVFDRHEMDHTGATIGTINEIKRVGKEIRGKGALSESDDPDTQMLVLRAQELFSEGAIGVSVSLDDVIGEDVDGVFVTTAGRIRSVAVVDEAAFSPARMSLVAGLRKTNAEWFADPKFGNGSKNPQESNGDDRLILQTPERPEEDAQYGAPVRVDDDGRIAGHCALWGRCHTGYSGTCVRPPREPAAYRGFLTGERVPGVPTGVLVMKTRHAANHLDANAAADHYDHTGYGIADVSIGADAFGIWVAGAVRPDATEADIEVLRASALSGDWRAVGGRHRLVGLLCVSAPGFRVARALAASGAIITNGPGCTSCEDAMSLEDRLEAVERIIASSLLAGL